MKTTKDGLIYQQLGRNKGLPADLKVATKEKVEIWDHVKRLPTKCHKSLTQKLDYLLGFSK